MPTSPGGATRERDEFIAGCPRLQQQIVGRRGGLSAASGSESASFIAFIATRRSDLDSRRVARFESGTWS